MADNSILRLKVDDKEYNPVIKEARKGLLALEETLQKTGKSFDTVDKSVVQYVREIGKMETSSKNAKGRISELSNAFVDLSTVYSRMSKQMQQSDVGKALEQSLQSIKQRAVESKRELERLGKELETTAPKTNVMKTSSSDLSKVLSELGSKYGVNVDLMSGAASKANIYAAAISATVVAVSAAAKALNDFNVELDKQQQVTTVTTGLKGPDADSMTATARALSDTYGVDFREVITAANTLMTQFGESGAEAMQLIREGMQGMIEGDGPKLLSMIQQYAPSFRDAGISASQLVAIIQNSEGGIFTDQNMNAIVMGIKNIRLMTESTSEALAKMGIDGQKMSQDLSAGTITIFDALQTVAQAIESTSSSSKEAGEVMQQVFGRKGSMAGTKLGEAIATLNTNLEETKKQTGEVGESLDNLVSANERLNTELMKTFGYDGWNAMANEIQAHLIVALADIVEGARRVKDVFVAVNAVVSPLSRAMKDFGNMSSIVLTTIETAAMNVLGPLGQILELLRAIGGASHRGTVQDAVDKANRNAADKQKFTVYLPQEDNWRNNPQSAKPQVPKVHAPKVRPSRKTGGGGGHKTTHTPPPEEQQNTARIAELVKQYQDLANAAKTADDAQKAGLTERMAKIQGEIKKLQDRNAELKKFADEAKQVQFPVGSLPQLNEQLKTLQTEQAKALDAKQWHDYQSQIEQTQYQIDALKGKWEDGLQATFKADDADVLAKVRDIEGITIDDKTLTVTANTAEAYNKVQELLKSVDGKTVTFTVQPKPEKPTYTQTFTEGAVSLPSIQAYISGLQSDIAKTDIGSDLFNKLTEKMSDAGRMSEVLKAAMESGVKGADLTSIAQEMKAKLLEGDITDEQWQEFLDKINEKIDNSELKLKIDVDTKGIITGADEQKKIAAQTQKAWDMAAQSVGNLSTALNSIEDPAAKAAGTVIKAIADIALGFAHASVQAGSMGPWGWVAWLAAGTAALASTISAVHSLTGFANGGIVGHAAGGYFVPGNSYSGDNIPIMANAGEVVLNRAQTGVLASALSEQSAPATSTPYVSGEKIYLGMENYLKRIGRGEIVTSRH